MLLFFVLLLSLTIGDYPPVHNIPVHYNTSWDGRDPRAVSWCSIVIIPSHLGFAMWDANPKRMVTYWMLTPIDWLSESVQVTTATNSSKNFRPLVIHNATSYFDGAEQSVNITLSWADLHPMIYVGLINPQYIGKHKYPLPVSGDYCNVYDVKYGPCANYWTDYNKTECQTN